MKKPILAMLAIMFSTPAALAQTSQQNEKPKLYVVPPTENAAPKSTDRVPSTNVTKEQIQQAQKIYNSMSPQQKAALADEVGKQAATIKPEPKAALIARAREYYHSLSPQEKIQLKKQLLELGSRLPPAEREAYLKKLDIMP